MYLQRTQLYFFASLFGRDQLLKEEFASLGANSFLGWTPRQRATSSNEANSYYNIIFVKRCEGVYNSKRVY